MTTKQLRARCDGITIVLGVMGLVLLLGPLVTGAIARAASAEDPVELNSSWTDALKPVETQWLDSFIGDGSHVDISSVLATGDYFAKRNLIEGDLLPLDFIMSGTRLTAAEIAAGKLENKDFIHLPISITGLVVATRAPFTERGWSTQLPCCQIVDGEEVPYPVVPYTDPIKIRPSVLMRLYQTGISLTTDSEFREDNGPNLVSEGNYRTGVIGRIDPGAIPKNLKTYFATLVPTAWADLLQGLGIPDPATVPVEDWPLLSVPTRSNDSALMTALVARATPDGAPAFSGNVGVSTLANFVAARTNYSVRDATTDLRPAQLKNAAGQFVSPTPQTILASINAGIKTGATPLDTTVTENAALTDATLTDAYPLTWVNWMIAPLNGLTADKANAVATIARYLVTDGQAEVTKAGEPALPQALVDQTLAAADALVKSNCTQSDYQLAQRTEPGEFAPPGYTLPAGRTIAWCEQKPVAATTTTTTIATTTTTTRAPTTTNATTTTISPTTTVPSTVATTPTSRPPNTVANVAPTTTATTTTTVPTASTTAPTTSVAATTTAPPPAATLPFGVPEGGRPPLDHVTTMALGAVSLLGAARRFTGRGG